MEFTPNAYQTLTLVWRLADQEMKSQWACTISPPNNTYPPGLVDVDFCTETYENMKASWK